jgi:hypothetical protein
VACVIVSLALLVVSSVLMPPLVPVDVALVWWGVVVGELNLTAVVVGLGWESLVVVLVARPWWLAVGDPAC